MSLTRIDDIKSLVEKLESLKPSNAEVFIFSIGSAGTDRQQQCPNFAIELAASGHVVRVFNIDRQFFDEKNYLFVDDDQLNANLPDDKKNKLHISWVIANLERETYGKRFWGWIDDNLSGKSSLPKSKVIIIDNRSLKISVGSNQISNEIMPEIVTLANKHSEKVGYQFAVVNNFFKNGPCFILKNFLTDKDSKNKHILSDFLVQVKEDITEWKNITEMHEQYYEDKYFEIFKKSGNFFGPCLGTINSDILLGNRLYDPIVLEGYAHVQFKQCEEVIKNNQEFISVADIKKAKKEKELAELEEYRKKINLATIGKETIENAKTDQPVLGGGNYLGNCKRSKGYLETVTFFLNHGEYGEKNARNLLETINAPGITLENADRAVHEAIKKSGKGEESLSTYIGKALWPSLFESEDKTEDASSLNQNLNQNSEETGNFEDSQEESPLVPRFNCN